jgi:hypothetical protein
LYPGSVVVAGIGDPGNGEKASAGKAGISDPGYNSVFNTAVY